MLEQVAGGRVVEIRPDPLRVETEAGPVTLHLRPQTDRWEGLFVADIPLEVGDRVLALGVRRPDGSSMWKNWG
ncbi:hypothetical protein [Thermoflexus hugenholtzii]